MLSIINSAFSAAAEQHKRKKLKQSVCLVAGEAYKGFVFGNGVFLRPDIILTCHHNLAGTEDLMVMDYKGNKTFTSKPLAIDKDLDSAILQLEKPLQGRPAHMGGDTEDYLHNMEAFLVNYYNGRGHINPFISPPSVQATGIDMDVETGLNIPFNSIRRTFTVKYPVVKGFSGSPIFDSRGLLSSMLCSVVFNYHTLQGVTPHRLCNFIHETLGTSPQRPIPNLDNNSFDNILSLR